MADDINKKSGSVNQSGSSGPIEDVLQSEFVSRVEQIGREFGRTTGRQQRLERLIQKSSEDQAKAERALMNQKFGSFSDEQTAMQQLREDFEGKRRSREEELGQVGSARITKAQDLARNALMNELSPARIRTQARELAQTDPSIQAEAARMAQTMSSRQIRQEQAGIQTTLGSLEVKGQNIINRGLFAPSSEAGMAFEVSPEGSKQIQMLSTSVGGIARQEAIVQAAQRIQRAQGRDYQSRMENIARGATSAQEALNVSNIGQQLSEKGAVTVSDVGDQGQVSSREVREKDIKGELVRQSEALLNVWKKLQTATEESAEKLQEHAEKIQENIDNLEEAQRQVGGGGGRSGNTIGNLMAFSGGFQALGAGAQQLFVGQRMQNMSNRAGLADIENEKYSTYRAALSGDMTAMMALGQFGAAGEFGKSIARGQNAAQGLQLAGSALETAAGGYMLAQGGGQQLNPIAQGLGTAGGAANTAAQGGQMMVQGLVNATVTGVDMYNQTSATSAKIQAENIDMATRRKLAEIPGFQMQQLYGLGMGMGTAAIGMGGGAEAFLGRTLGDNAFLDRMRGMNISPEQMGQMVGFGVNNIGSTFNEEMAFTARGLEKSGRGTREENLQRMGMLAQAGANNPQVALQNVLEAAVGRGFDNSKSMTLLVQNTAEMAKQSAVAMAGGVDMTGTISTILAAGADRGLTNREFALERARTVQESITETATNVSTDLAGLMNTTGISARTGLSASSAQFAAQLTPAEVQSYMKMDESKARAELVSRGINPEEFKGGVKAGLQGLYQNQISSLVRGAGMRGVAFGTDEQRARIEAALSKGEAGYRSLSEEDKVLAGRLMPGIRGEELFRGAGAISATNESGAAQNVNNAMKGEGAGEFLKSIDKLRTAGFGQLSDAAKQATTQFGSAAETMKKLADQVERLRGADVEKVMSDAAAKAAGTGEGSKVFSDAVDVFKEAVDKLAVKAGIDTTSMRREESSTQRAAENLNQGVKQKAGMNSVGGRR